MFNDKDVEWVPSTVCFKAAEIAHHMVEEIKYSDSITQKLTSSEKEN